MGSHSSYACRRGQQVSPGRVVKNSCLKPQRADQQNQGRWPQGLITTSPVQLRCSLTPNCSQRSLRISKMATFEENLYFGICFDDFSLIPATVPTLGKICNNVFQHFHTRDTFSCIQNNVECFFIPQAFFSFLNF